MNYTISYLGRTDNHLAILSKEDWRGIKKLWRAHVAGFWGSRQTKVFNSLLECLEKAGSQVLVCNENEGKLQLRFRGNRYFEIRPA